MYGGEIGSGGTYNQPLTVDTGCPSPSSTRTSNPLTTAPPSTQPTPIYGGQSGAPPPQYHHGIPVLINISNKLIILIYHITKPYFLDNNGAELKD